MLRTAQLHPQQAFDPNRFQTDPPVCYRASWQLSGPDSHRQATTSTNSKITSNYVTRHLPVPLGARRARASALQTQAVFPGNSLAGRGTHCRAEGPAAARWSLVAACHRQSWRWKDGDAVRAGLRRAVWRVGDRQNLARRRRARLRSVPDARATLACPACRRRRAAPARRQLPGRRLARYAPGRRRRRAAPRHSAEA
jgi:hypothetical protein